MVISIIYEVGFDLAGDAFFSPRARTTNRCFVPQRRGNFGADNLFPTIFLPHYLSTLTPDTTPKHPLPIFRLPSAVCFKEEENDDNDDDNSDEDDAIEGGPRGWYR